MITLIAGTNRKDSKTIIVTQTIAGLLKKHNIPHQILDLSDIALEDLDNNYNEAAMSSNLQQIQDTYMIGAEKYIFITPEYNGSYPGILKLFIDAISVRQFRGGIAHKKALLIGVASGRSGNLRGLDHLAGVLEYCMVTIFPNKLPISSVHTLMSDGEMTDQKTIEVLDQLLTDYLKF